MHPKLRSSLPLIAVLACVDASAAVRRNCVTLLEAQPRPVASGVAATKKPCPVAAGYVQRTPAPRDALVETAVPAPARARV